MINIKKIIILISCLGLLIVTPISTSFAQLGGGTGLTYDTKIDTVKPTSLNYQAKRYPVIEIQYDANSTFSDFEIKVSLTNFDKNANVFLPGSSYANTNWNLMTKSEFTSALSSLSQYFDQTKLPSNWNSMNDLDKHAYLVSRTGAYFYFYGTFLQHSTRYDQFRNDGNISVYINITSQRVMANYDSNYDPRFVIKLPKYTFGQPYTKYFYTGGSTIQSYTFYFNTSNQAYFSINNSYTAQSSSISGRGSTSSIVAVVNYADYSTMSDADGEYQLKVLNRALNLYMVPTNLDLKFCYILTSASSWETDNQGKRRYRNIVPKEWIKSGTLGE